jgi:MYXO-CTERM domain-containing protein
VSTAYCTPTGSCQLRGLAGTPCDATIASACGDGLACQDGLCCQDPQCDAHGGFCAGGHPGVCLGVNDTTCAKDADCSSGHCAEIDATSGKGICCDTACTGLCETCTSSSTPGTCVPVHGAPSTSHGSCPPATGDACSGSICDGKGRATCDGKPGPETICQQASCAGGKFNPDVACNGTGACPTVPLAYCDGFRVCASATTCATGACTADTDCADGYVCVASTGVCAPKAAHCKDGDPTTAVDAQGHEQSCAPYLCGTTGACRSSCAQSADCTGGYVCDVGAQQCVTPGSSSGTTASGGCAVHGPSDRASEFGAALLAIAAIALRRRRAR